MSTHIIISGASSGIGFSLASDLASCGYKVFAGYRKEADEEKLRKAHANITPLLLDILNNENILSSREVIKKHLDPESTLVLINNAGIALPAPLETILVKDVSLMLQTNITQQLAITQAFLPLLRQQPNSRIIFVGSTSGLISLPLLSAYSITKFGLSSLADGLRRELNLTSKIKVIEIMPEAISTPMLDRATTHLIDCIKKEEGELKEYYLSIAEKIIEKQNTSKLLDMKDLVKIFHHAIESPRPKPRYYAGKNAKLLALISRILPVRLIDTIISRRLKNLA